MLILTFVLYPARHFSGENNVIYICQGCFVVVVVVVVVFVVAVVVVSHKIRDDVCPGIDCNSHRQHSFVCLFVCLFVHRLPTRQLHNFCLF